MAFQIKNMNYDIMNTETKHTSEKKQRHWWNYWAVHLPTICFVSGRAIKKKTSQGVYSKKRTCMCHVSILALQKLDKSCPWNDLEKCEFWGSNPPPMAHNLSNPPNPRVVQKFSATVWTHPSASCLPIVSWLSKRYQFNLHSGNLT